MISLLILDVITSGTTRPITCKLKIPGAGKLEHKFHAKHLCKKVRAARCCYEVQLFLLADSEDELIS
jgi:hypothetical protein